MSRKPGAKPPKVAVGARVDEEVRDRILGLRDVFRRGTGEPACVSEVMRRLLQDGLTVSDPTLVIRINDEAVRRKTTPAMVFDLALAGGLSALEDDVLGADAEKTETEGTG